MPEPFPDITAIHEALRHTTSGVALTDRAGNIQWVNPAFEKLFGYTAAEAVASAPGLHPFGEHSGAACAEFWRTVLSGESWRSTVRNHRKNGTPFQSNVVVIPLMASGGRLAWLLTAHSAPVVVRPEEQDGLARLETLLDHCRGAAIRSPRDKVTAG